MEQQKNTYSGRFVDSKAAKPAQDTSEPRKAPPRPERKPSGFSSVGQAPKHTVQKSAPEAKQPKKKQKIKKEKYKRATGKRKVTVKRVLTACLIVVLSALILLVIFGDRGTYHQMPTITREEAEGSFAPEVTPLPGVEEAI